MQILILISTLINYLFFTEIHLILMKKSCFLSFLFCILSLSTLKAQVLADSSSLFSQKDTICDTIFPSEIDQLGITVVAVGDIMLGTNYPSEKYLPPNNNCFPLLAEVKPYLMDATFTFGNLEGVFSSNGGTPKTCKDTTKCYVFRMPDSYLDCIIDAGFDALSMANNHVNDFGYIGRLNTSSHLTANGMPWAGLDSKPYAIIEKDGRKIGFAAFAPHSGTLDMKDYAGAKKLVAMLNDSCDFVLVYFHGGSEGKDCQHVTRQDEEFMGHNRGNVYRFAHDVIDAGADLVIGSGPHVTRAVEIYKDRLIAYSLGNFSTYARFNLAGPNGICPLIKTWLAPDGSFIKAQIVPVYQTGEGGAKPDPHKRAIYKIRELTYADFPDSPVNIDDEGWIFKK